MDTEGMVRDVAEHVRELMADAEARAKAIVEAAEADAARIRERAEADARERLAEVRSALDELQGKLGAVAPDAEVTPGPVTVPEPSPPSVPEPTPDPVPEPTPDPVPDPVPGPEPVPEPTPDPSPEEPVDEANGARSADKSAARLVAMKMALDGASREDIEAHLEANYDVENRDKLLDDVMSRAKA